nr:NAD(P)-binding domain-containing protein [Terrimonas sp. H1YJ31]
MRIGIIGIGAIGSTLAKKLAATGHQIKVTSTATPSELALKAKALNAAPATIEEVVKDVDVIFLSIPTAAIPKLSKDLFKDIPNTVVIVDTSNYYPFRDGEIEYLKNGKVESEWVSEQIGRPVVKAFNNLLAYTLENLGKPKGGENRIAIAVAGDDQNAKEIVVRLISDTGFDTVDAGNLSQSWRQQPGTPAYCTELNATELKQALADGIKEKAAELRDFAITKLMGLTTPPTHNDIIELNRSLFPKTPKGV